MTVLILWSWLAFLKKSMATLFVSSFLSRAINLPSLGNAREMERALRPVNVQI